MAKPLKVKKISPEDQINEAAERILRTRLKEFYSHRTDSNSPPTFEQLHNLRISGKRLRYSAEALRDLFPDRLGLLIDLLKRNQELLGEIHDCITQKAIIEADLSRLKKRKPESDHIPVYEGMIDDYDRRRSERFDQFLEIWLGMSLEEFRRSLKKMVSRKEGDQKDARGEKEIAKHAK